MTNNQSRKSGSPWSKITKGVRANAWGIASFVFGLIGLFILAPIFVPPALVFGVIAVVKRQLVWGALGLLCGAIGFIFLWGWLVS